MKSKEPHAYTIDTALCPDSCHPHVSDLGQPSGVKWLCCNYEASAPEEAGGYFTFAKTDSAALFEPHRCQQYLQFRAKYDAVKDQLWGTQYDIVHVRTGGALRMPSCYEAQVLIKHCASRRVYCHGCEGLLLTAPNGTHLFLPRTGCRVEGGVVLERECFNRTGTIFDERV